MSLPVAILGDNLLAKRIVLALSKIPAFELLGPECAAVQVNCTPPTIHESSQPSDLLEQVEDPLHLFGGPIVHGPNTIERLPSSDACAVLRVLKAVSGLGRFHRCFAKVITRTARASETGLVDGLQPTFEDPIVERELETLFQSDEADTVNFVVRRVVAPYTHSHLLHLKLDFTDRIDQAAALDAMNAAPRILVGSATRDGLTSTAHLQEFFRDLGRPGGERPELFVWEESVLCDGKSLHLIVDHSPDSILIPEVIDAIRQVDDSFSQGENTGQTTDRLLCLWHDLRGPLA